jgi:hypothetical protein
MEPPSEQVKAIDVLPFHWALWCSIADGKPFANDIVAVRWTEDDQRLRFMLDTHNFIFALPDEEMTLIRCDVSKMSPTRTHAIQQEHEKLVASRRTPLEIEKRRALLDAKAAIDKALSL